MQTAQLRPAVAFHGPARPLRAMLNAECEMFNVQGSKDWNIEAIGHAGEFY